MTDLHPEPGAKAKMAIGPVSRSTETSPRRAQLIASFARWTGLPSNTRAAVCPRRGPGSFRPVRRET
jgi:hypothetical protein